ncbi:unnamed protein product [Dovyalis caffra]|uniref:Uncharacterized protein n=1 Tax=Dovyalis caffra TaxID=77055 RepID=A0AAV1STY4_9ROSI|nr:unnamed protein product [Dovyalis caffra]
MSVAKRKNLGKDATESRSNDTELASCNLISSDPKSDLKFPQPQQTNAYAHAYEAVQLDR